MIQAVPKSAPQQDEPARQRDSSELRRKILPSWLLAPFWAFSLSRVLLVLVLVFVSQVDTETIPAREGQNHHLRLVLSKDRISNSLEKILLSADATWYREIAEGGYQPGPLTTSEPKNWVFFPLFPLIARALSSLSGEYLLTVMLFSNIAFYCALVLLYRLSRELSYSDSEAKLALWLLCFFPTSYFFTPPFSESTFLVLLLLGFYMLERGWKIRSAFAMALLTAARPTGLLVLPAYAIRLIAKERRLDLRSLFALLIAPLGAFSFLVFMWMHTGDPLAFVLNQAAWGRGQTNFMTLLSQLDFRSETMSLPWNFVLINLAAACLALGSGAYFFVKKEISWGLLVSVPIIVPLATGTLQSVARFTVVLFPIFLLLSFAAKRPTLEKALLAIFAILFGILTAMYGLHITAAMA